MSARMELRLVSVEASSVVRVGLSEAIKFFSAFKPDRLRLSSLFSFTLSIERATRLCRSRLVNLLPCKFRDTIAGVLERSSVVSSLSARASIPILGASIVIAVILALGARNDRHSP